MFACQYKYTNDQQIMVQGLLEAYAVLAEKSNQVVDRVALKCLNHSNKYVRRIALVVAPKLTTA